jgi:hypothetical protein
MLSHVFDPVTIAEAIPPRFIRRLILSAGKILFI